MPHAPVWRFDRADRLDGLVSTAERIAHFLERRRPETSYADRPALNRRVRLTRDRLDRLRQARRLARRELRLATA